MGGTTLVLQFAQSSTHPAGKPECWWQAKGAATTPPISVLRSRFPVPRRASWEGWQIYTRRMLCGIFAIPSWRPSRPRCVQRLLPALDPTRPLGDGCRRAREGQMARRVLGADLLAAALRIPLRERQSLPDTGHKVIQEIGGHCTIEQGTTFTLGSGSAWTNVEPPFPQTEAEQLAWQ